MIEKFFEREFGGHKLEPVETGVLMEYCKPVLESTFEEEDTSDLLFGCMEHPSRTESIVDHPLCGVAEQLYRLDLIQEIPVLADSLPPACGMSIMDIEYLLNMQEFSFESLHGASLSDITEALSQDYRVLCAIRIPNQTGSGMLPSPYESSCLAEVRGIDLRSPNSAKICFDSLSGVPVSGQCSLEEFMKAWQFHNNRCYIIYREPYHEY